jgi:hypothetical protein
VAENHRSEGSFRFYYYFILSIADSQFSAIEKDAVDPDFLSNLNRLGQVRVDHHMQTVQPVC